MRPSLSYIVCATQRSGSNLLCDGLIQTGVAGVPDEYFVHWCKEDTGDVDPEWRLPRRDFLRKLYETGSTPNGVFGLKLMGNYLDRVLATLRELDDYRGLSDGEVLARLCPGVRYIYLTRVDKVKQAVSIVKATQSGNWRTDHPAQRTGELRYDYGLIRTHYFYLLDYEERWKRYFQEATIDPLRLAFDEVVADFAGSTLRVLDFIGIPRPAGFSPPAPRLKSQSDSTNEDWARRFAAELAERNGADRAGSP